MKPIYIERTQKYGGEPTKEVTMQMMCSPQNPKGKIAHIKHIMKQLNKSNDPDHYGTADMFLIIKVQFCEIISRRECSCLLSFQMNAIVRGGNYLDYNPKI